MTAPPPQEPRHVVVEGPIGVGKTTLARRLADSLGLQMLLEAPEANPFLERFYREGRRSALPAQLFFLLQRVEQLRSWHDEDLFAPAVVSDFLMAKDRLFAEATLDAEELALYEEVAGQLAVPAPTPDLVVYLQAPVPVLVQRIRARAIPSEQGMDPAYLERLADAYARFFHFYDDAPLLIVNAAEIDLVNDHEQYERLLGIVRAPRGLRSYFNPQPSLI